MLYKIALFCLVSVFTYCSFFKTNQNHIFSNSIPIQEVQDLIISYLDDFKFSSATAIMQEPIQTIISTNNGKYFLTISKTRNVFVWDATTFRHLHMITTDGIRAITHSCTYNQVALLGKNFSDDKCFIEISNLARPTLIDEFIPANRNAQDLHFAPDGKFLAVSSSDKIQLLDTTNYKVIQELPGQAIVACIIALNSQYIALITRRDGVKIWDIANNKIKSMEHQSTDITQSGIAYAPNSKQIAAIGTDRCIVWNAQTGKKLFSKQNNQWRNSHISYLPHGNSFAISSNSQLANNAKIEIIDARTFALLQTLKRDGQQITCFSFSPNKKFLLAVCASGDLLTWVNQIGDFVHQPAEETSLEKESKKQSGCVIC